MNRKQGLLFIFGLIFVGVSVCQIYNTRHGITVIRQNTANPPVTVITQADASPTSRPTVLIAHGFAGSSVLMQGFALTLAHAGYSTVSWDFDGHGTNPNPLPPSSISNELLKNAEAALAEAETTGLIDPTRIAIIGHSMGSGVALSYGSTHPETRATIAISPVSQSVTPDLPHNLLLLAGSLEPQFIANARQELALAGGEGGEVSNGTARRLNIIPNVEHITILFSPKSHATVRAWLDATFGPQPGAENYTDRRVLWFGLGISGFLLLSSSSINTFSVKNLVNITISPLLSRVIALPVGCLVATGLLWLISKLGVHLNQLLGLLVGGYILVWFGVAGVISFLILRPHFHLPKSRELIICLIAFGALWLGVGVLGNFVWLPWMLIPQRLWLWMPSSILLLPWFYSIGEASRGTNKLSQFGWWLCQVISVVAGLVLALSLNPELGFIFLILPLIPVMLGLHMLAISSKQGIWAFALSGAMFTAWLLLAVFPLQ